MKKNKIIQSMLKNGNYFDNSIMESVFGTLKNNFYNNIFTSIEEFKIEFNNYIVKSKNDCNKLSSRLNSHKIYL